MNRECVLNCDFFRDVSNECIIRLVHSFKFAVFLKSDVLAEEGELASEMVFLIHGSVKVIKMGKIMPISLLSAGDYFGKFCIYLLFLCSFVVSFSTVLNFYILTSTHCTTPAFLHNF